MSRVQTDGEIPDTDMASHFQAENSNALNSEHNVSDFDAEFLGIWEKASPYTMISPERGWALAEAVRYVCRRKIPGDIVECGVWRGGACLLASHILAIEASQESRRIWLFDTFEGMVSPTEEDRIAFSGQALRERNPEGWWSANLTEVKQVLKLSPLDIQRFELIPGRVEHTLLVKIPEEISILRLDTDWYASTSLELEILYPKLSSGGILIIDDYGHFTGARKAVDEYFAKRKTPVLLHRSDYSGRVVVKD